MTPNTAYLLSDASRARTPTTFTTCQSIFRLISPSTCSTYFPQSPHPSPLPSTASHQRLERLEVNQITGHQFVIGRRGGVIIVMCGTHWTGVNSPFGEYKRDLQHYRLRILHYWSGTSSKHRQVYRVYRQVRIEAAHRELSRSRGESFLSTGYNLVSPTIWLGRFGSSTLPPGHGSDTRPAKSPPTPRLATPQPTPTSSSSPTTQARSRSTSCRRSA